MLRNCPISASNITIAKRVYGPNIVGVQGESVWRSPCPAVSDCISIPPQNRVLNSVLDISAGLMFINGLAFFFQAFTIIACRTKSQLVSSLKLVNIFHKSNGFAINTYFTNGEFECLKHNAEGVSVNTALVKNEHVGDTERNIRTIQDQVCALCSDYSIPDNHEDGGIRPDMAGCIPSGRGVHDIQPKDNYHGLPA